MALAHVGPLVSQHLRGLAGHQGGMSSQKMVRPNELVGSRPAVEAST